MASKDDVWSSAKAKYEASRPSVGQRNSALVDDYFSRAAQKYKDREQKEPTAAENIKGFLKQAAYQAPSVAAGTYGDFQSLLGTKEMTPGEKALREAEESNPDLAALSGDEFAPRISEAYLPTSREVGRAIGKPEAETDAERFGERVGTGLGAGLLGGIGGAIAGGVGAVAGQGVEKLTGSPLAGIIAELGTGAAGGLLRGPRLITNKAQQSLIDSAKRLGVSEASVAPLLKAEGTINFWNTFSPKTASTAKKAAEIQNSLGGAYDLIKSSAADLGQLAPDARSKLFRGLSRIADRLESPLAQSTDRSAALKWVNDATERLVNNPVTYDQLIDTYQELNRIIPWNSKVSGGKKLLANLKDSLTDVIGAKNPELARDFGNINKLYEKSIKLKSHLTPQQYEKAAEWLFTLGEAGTLGYGILTLNPLLMASPFGMVAGRKIARNIMFNPRINNFHLRLANAAKKQSIPAMERVLADLNKELEKESES